MNGSAARRALLAVLLVIGAGAVSAHAPEPRSPATRPRAVDRPASVAAVGPNTRAHASPPPTPRPVAAPYPRAGVPVLLVPGWWDTGRELAGLRLRLLSAGWSGDAVEAITFREVTGSNRDHADELGVAVRALLERTGAADVDIVAHSMGGLATRWYLLRNPEAPVRRVVFIASPHRGTLSAHFAWGGGRAEMMPDSPFLDTLNTEAPVPTNVEIITIRTSVDTHIVPSENATLPGVTNFLLCCPTHAGLLRDQEVFAIVRRFLEDGVSP